MSYRGDPSWDEVFFRSAVQVFNRVSTWRLLTAQLGEVTWEGYDFTAYDGVLGRQLVTGKRLYSAA